MKSNEEITPAVLLFDGVCNLCNGSVQFILKHEKSEKLKFSAIQSEAGQKLLSQYNINPEQTNSVILICDGVVYTESDAVAKVAEFLKFPYNTGRYMKVVPRQIRNVFYKKVASNRYKWFGQKESCMIPTPDLRNRFLQ
ncbi:thiol-disulfide oxidoreductase DCC family protein [Fictibacillus phosphorivorans]|uniref:thiol-disulfide oxidoreductase DCC family protein n=1 Tax=Fictibacillus phosphorivorans TaxID=1221500 RepID=UPI00119DBF33|nr:DCC1-like thiol-disulfide oxidoreductase family protein [Fictibacillus phosphorivorans]